MSNFSAHKQQVKRPSVYKPIHQELEKARDNSMIT